MREKRLKMTLERLGKAEEAMVCRLDMEAKKRKMTKMFNTIVVVDDWADWSDILDRNAGGILNTYTEDGEWNRDDISQWLRAPEVVKENYANGLPDGELPRGMPNLGLSERTISDLVAYLETLGQKPSAEILAATEVE